MYTFIYLFVLQTMETGTAAAIPTTNLCVGQTFKSRNPCRQTCVFTRASLKAQLRAPGNKPARGKVLQTYLSPLRQERVGRAGALVCLVVPSNQRRSDPPPGRRK